MALQAQRVANQRYVPYTTGQVFVNGDSAMANPPAPSWKSMLLDKTLVQKLVDEQNRLIGFAPDPSATPEKVQAMTRALGIRPEDNLLSCGIIAARDEE